MAGERKLATILFADIVGSTALGARLDPEVIQERLNRTFARLKEVLTAHGGTVEKFIGDSVMAVFGVPVTHEDDADRAVRAAIAIGGAVTEMNRVGSMPIELRIGIDTGEVVAAREGRSDRLVTGMPVNAAARLQQAAAPAEILVGELTYQLTRRTTTYGSERPVEAKGLGPLRAWPIEAARFALPERRRGLPGRRASLVGRDEEMRLLLESHHRAGRQRRPYLITVFGPAGAGKSRLAAEFVEAVHPAVVLRGRCLPYGEGITYWPIQEILRSAVGVETTDTHEELEQKVRSSAAQLFDGDPDGEGVANRLLVLIGSAPAKTALRDVTTENMADELRWGLRRYLERRADQGVVTLVFEDIHWAESSLLDLVDHLVEWARAPLFVLCLARPELLDLRPAWGGGKVNAAAIQLEPLSAEETSRLIGELLSIDALPQPLRQEMIARAEGNPLFVEEFLRMLIDAGHVVEDGGRWMARSADLSLRIPATVQGLIAARLDQLPPETKQLLQRAAVVGKVFYVDALQALGPPNGRIDDALLNLARRDLIQEADDRGPGGGRSYRFKHILIRDVAYSSIPKSERFRLHDRFREWLEATDPNRKQEYGEIAAYHAEQAFLLAQELADPQASQLGQRALARLLAAATRARQQGDMHASRVLHERAYAVGKAIGAPDAKLAEIAAFRAVARHRLEGSADTLVEMDRVLPEARAAGPSEALVLLLTERGEAALNESIALSRSLFEEAVQVARATGDRELIARALLGLRRPSWMIGDLSTHQRLLDQAYAYMQAAGVRTFLPECVASLGGTAFFRGDLSDAMRFLDEAYELARAAESRSAWRLFNFGSATVPAVAGDFERAVSLAEELMMRAKDLGERDRIVSACWVCGWVQHLAGNLSRARSVLEEGLATVDPRTGFGMYSELQQRLARTALALGDLQTAREAAETACRTVHPSDVYTIGTATAALAAVRAAEGRPVEAERLFRDALQATEPTGYGWLTSDIRRSLAEFLMAQGRFREARPILEAVRSFYHDPAGAYQRQQIDALLGRCDQELASR